MRLTPVGENLREIVAEARGTRATELLERWQDALAESERRFRTVVESMDEGVIITDLDDVIQHVNPSALALTGYALDELLGRAAFATLIPREAHGEFRERMGRRRSGVAEPPSISRCTVAGQTRCTVPVLPSIVWRGVPSRATRTRSPSFKAAALSASGGVICYHMRRTRGQRLRAPPLPPPKRGGV